MKKALLYGLSAVMLLSLTACGTAQANQPNEPDTTQPSAVQAEPPQETPAVEPLSANGDVKDVTGKELEELFESGYQVGQVYKDLGLNEDELIIMEISTIVSIVDGRTDIKTPIDLDTQYRAWRAETHPDTPTQDLIPDIPPENYIDQDNIDAGWEADIDPNTGEVNYWNPNTVEEPTNPGLVITPAGESAPGYRDPSEDQSAGDAGYDPDPNAGWENIIYGH